MKLIKEQEIKPWDAQECPLHGNLVHPKISKKTGSKYWMCMAGDKPHFLQDPNYDPREGYGQDEENAMC